MWHWYSTTMCFDFTTYAFYSSITQTTLNQSIYLDGFCQYTMIPNINIHTGDGCASVTDVPQCMLMIYSAPEIKPYF